MEFTGSDFSDRLLSSVDSRWCWLVLEAIPHPGGMSSTSVFSSGWTVLDSRLRN